MVTLHMYAERGEIGSATVTGGKVQPGGSEVVTRAIEASAKARGWTAEQAVAALDGQWNGYWCYSTSPANPYDLPADAARYGRDAWAAAMAVAGPDDGTGPEG